MLFSDPQRMMAPLQKAVQDSARMSLRVKAKSVWDRKKTEILLRRMMQLMLR